MSESSPPALRWTVLPDSDAVALMARDKIIKAAHAAIQRHGSFRIVLAGGSTPKQVYELLGDQDCNWARWQLYLGDERCLPGAHPDRNSSMIRNTLLNRATIPPENIHFIPAELGAKIAAQRYTETIQSAMPFDLVLLGMGEDGHTASLFPGQGQPNNETVHAVHNAPKPPAERVSLSAKTLSDTQQLLILVCGEGKQSTLTQWQQGVALPIAKIRAHRRMQILLDEAANSPSLSRLVKFTT